MDENNFIFLAEQVKDLICAFNKADEVSSVLFIGIVGDNAIIAGNPNSPVALASLIDGAMKDGTREHNLFMAAVEYYLRHGFNEVKRAECAFDGRSVDEAMNEILSVFKRSQE